MVLEVNIWALGHRGFLDTRVWHYLISILSAFHWVLWRGPLGGSQRKTVFPVKRTSQSFGWEVWGPPGASQLIWRLRERVYCSVVSNSLPSYGLQPARLLCPWDAPGKITGLGCHSLLQGVFPTQVPNPDLLHCRHVLYCLGPQGSPNTEIMLN